MPGESGLMSMVLRLRNAYITILILVLRAQDTGNMDSKLTVLS